MNKAIVFLSGVLGNQMFQYAKAQSMKEKGFSVVCDWGLLKKGNQHNGYELDRVFDNVEATCSFFNTFFIRILYYLTFVYKVRLLLSFVEFLGWSYVMNDEELEKSNSRTSKLMVGYWMLFKNIPKQYRSHFRLETLNESSITFARRMRSENSFDSYSKRRLFSPRKPLVIWGYLY